MVGVSSTGSLVVENRIVSEITVTHPVNTTYPVRSVRIVQLTRKTMTGKYTLSVSGP